MTGTGQRNRARITGNTCWSIQSHPSLPYIPPDNSWRDEEVMLCMRQLQSCYTSLLSPWPLLIPQGHLTLDVLVPRHLTALLYPGSPADPCKTALRTKWGPEGEFAGSHGPTLPPILSAETFCHRQKGAGGVPMGRPFRRTFKYVLEQKGKIL